MVWVSDFTYIKVNSGWFYLCIIMDLFSRKIISWNISNKADCNLIINTFNEAYTKRNYSTGLIFNFDCGTQYTSSPFKNSWINIVSFNLFLKRVSF
ncbi:transposase [Gemella morbillorum]|uniref:transposase n=1 Tax=Gemella morbillorum TaxID=29391 RepID=UPI0036F25952